MSHEPISLVLRARNSAATLGEVLRALDLGEGDEIVLVDSGSTDATLAIARSHGARIVSIPAESFTYGHALNVGFQAARNPWVLSLSSHTVPARPGFLAAYRRALGRFPSTVVAAVGPILGEFGAPLPAGLTLYEGDDLAEGFGFGAGNPNALYRRSAWERHPFDPKSEGGEDLQWYVEALRSGETVAAVHDAPVRYLSRRTFAAFYRKGRVDHRAAVRWIRVRPPTVAGVAVRCLKLSAFLLLGRMDWHGAKGGIAHALGGLAESRALARKAGGP